MIKKIKRKYLWWIPKCKILNIILILSLIGFFSYEVTKEWPERFPYADILYQFVSYLSLSVIGSYIFYVIVVYYPAKQIQRHQIHHFKGSIERYLDVFFKEFGSSTKSLTILYFNLESNASKLNERDTWAKLNHNDNQKTYETLFAIIIAFEKDLERYLDKFTSSYISENAEIISKMNLIHINDEIISHYRSNLLLEKNTSEDFKLNFIMQCIFGKSITDGNPYKIKDSFKTHMKNCEELLEVLKACYY